MNTNRTSPTGLIVKAAMLVGLVAGTLPGLAFAGATSSKTVDGGTAAPSQRHHGRCGNGAEAFTRIDLFFGLSRPGGVVTEEEFKAFVDTRITPRFPDGLTLLSGTGQFRNAQGTIVVEGSKVLVLLVPHRDQQADAKVEAIRSDYRRQFQQESVLRSDTASCASF